MDWGVWEDSATHLCIIVCENFKENAFAVKLPETAFLRQNLLDWIFTFRLCCSVLQPIFSLFLVLCYNLYSQWERLGQEMAGKQEIRNQKFEPCPLCLRRCLDTSNTVPVSGKIHQSCMKKSVGLAADYPAWNRLHDGKKHQTDMAGNKTFLIHGTATEVMV
ncbi:hypothetical protein Y1Q_0005720 [Alligator mississippiensis]|uniref:Uncharacterized protein n=1 Tax=Alligator mississippiensis TaxID=8496 RepID=A0A151MFN2_ALLMI|nr:hypothetical protein Y1Q_0005720 [Alligator mississippiensis]